MKEDEAKEAVSKSLEGSALEAIKGQKEIRTIDLPPVEMDKLRRAHKFDPANLAEAMTLAEMLAKLGSDMIPKEIVGKPAAIITRIMQGNEIGLPAMTSLHAVVMINGRPCVWGEVALALYAAHPNYLKHSEQFVDDGPAGLTAVCVVECRNGGTFTGSFSSADAAKARLDGRDTYKLYQRDMLMWRARHRAFAPACPGALKNVGIAQMARDDISVEVIDRGAMPQPALPPQTRTEALKEKIKGKGKATPKAEETAAEAPPAVTLEEVISVIAKAENAEALDLAADLANELLLDSDKSLARKAYKDKRAALQS